jgi:hypothetical protein
VCVCVCVCVCTVRVRVKRGGRVHVISSLFATLSS